MNKVIEMIGGLLGGGFHWLQPKVQSVGDFIFFRQIMAYLQDKIERFGIDMLGRSMQWVTGIALTLLTLWIIIQGYRIITGQSRESMMALVTNSLRAVLILTAATMMSAFGTNLSKFLNDDIKKEINWIVTGENVSPEDRIDESLGWMQVALSSIDAIDVMSDPTLDSQKSRALWFAGMGAGGPAIAGGVLFLMYQVALALFIGLGPLFILCLLFDQTKSLFQRWLLYGIGTMFSMAVLSAMVSIALDMVVRVAVAFWTTAAAGALLGSNFTDGMTSQAMQQGGMGLILTMLIISVPPMAATFFQGTLGGFMHFSAFGGGGGAPIGQRPGESGYGGAYAAQTAPSPNSQRTESANASPTGNPNFGNNAVTTPNYGKSSIQSDQVKDGPRQG